MQQDSIIYLYLLNHLVKHYIKIAFLYNYSILFDCHETNDLSRLKMYTRRNSQPRNSIDLINEKPSNDFLVTKRERIKRYFALYNNNFNDQINSDPAKSYYSSLSSLASSLIGFDSQKQRSITKNKKSSVSSSTEDDFELLKVILALVEFNTTKSTVAANANNNSVNSNTHSPSNLNSNFDQTDLNIINHILRTLQIKQLYLYDLAMKKKLVKENHLKLDKDVANNSNTSNTNKSNITSNEIQFSLLVDYEELTTFYSKK